MDDYGWLIPAGIAAGGVLSSMSSENQASKDRKASREQLDAVLNEIRGIKDPELQKYTLEQYANQYNFTPEQVQAISQQSSSLANYAPDAATKQAQMDALSQLGQLSKTGLTDADKAAIQDINLQNDSHERGSQEAIMQEMARRGQSGGSQELAARLLASQGSTDRAAADARAVQQSSQQRALQALIQQGQLASSLRGQDLTEAEKRAQAQDTINRFNTANAQQVMGANVNARNQAAREQSLQSQNLSNQNVDVRNRNLGQSNDLNQQRYNNVMSKYSSILGGANNSAQMGMQSANAANAGRYRQTQAIQGLGNSTYSAYNSANTPEASYNESTGERKKNYDPQTGEELPYG